MKAGKNNLTEGKKLEPPIKEDMIIRGAGEELEKNTKAAIQEKENSRSRDSWY